MNNDNKEEDEDVIIKFVKSIYDDDEFIKAKNIMALSLELYDIEFHANRYPLGLYYHIKIVALLYYITENANDDIYNAIIKYIKKTLPYESCVFYLNIVDRISYESKMLDKQTDFLGVLTESGIFIRDIVSDADKIIWINHEKLIGLAKVKYKLSNSVEEKELFACVDKLITEKIKDIYKYIRTKAAKKITIHKRSELYITHEDWRKKLI